MSVFIFCFLFFLSFLLFVGLKAEMLLSESLSLGEFEGVIKWYKQQASSQQPRTNSSYDTLLLHVQ